VLQCSIYLDWNDALKAVEARSTGSTWMPSSGTQGDSAEVEVAISRTPLPNRQKGMLCVGRLACVFSLREDTQEGLVGLCEAGCRVLSVSAAPALVREFYA
jgi:hypothetical protein